MVTRAQLSQERSRVRRDELLAAAIDLFIEGGSRAITHRAVAARAGLPPATTTYYFESIDELIREALSSHITQWTVELDALAQIDIDVSVSLDEAATFMGNVFAHRGPEAAAVELSIFLAAAREPGLRHAAQAAITSLEAVATSVLGQLGVDRPERLAAMIVSLVAGTALRRQAGVYAEDEEARILTAAVRDLVAAHTLGPDGVDRTLATLRPEPA
ncbi:TetR family transcriptional regulator [Aeromicrobium sp. SMF47]|uniref:TetR family transcriptional regulator n=1 Tax=Aeromicrobium yanjiei TaxID=2662028 RepID=A0A5Q2ML03_9ACTN|nr:MULTISPECIES: TetR family transcriptional regulator [Aeromicrobium]MRJ76342.1 TetR family transcriptional regulator [Aeromicrobium yanjiei]MRK00693.1 TetR family transcriptional regulator [Aeromicrobium sp. S22]QGG42479.1 TetR family transcriptional regulator [Aeromicrobium yanjiei]